MRIQEFKQTAFLFHGRERMCFWRLKILSVLEVFPNANTDEVADCLSPILRDQSLEDKDVLATFLSVYDVLEKTKPLLMESIMKCVFRSKSLLCFALFWIAWAKLSVKLDKKTDALKICQKGLKTENLDNPGKIEKALKNINANEQIELDVFNESRSGSASLLSVIRSLEQQDKIEKASLKEVSQQLGELLHSSSELRNEVENFKRQTSLCFRELKEEMEKSKRDMLRASALNHTEVLSSIEDKLNSFHYQLNLKDNRKGGEDSNFEETKVQEDSFISFISQSSSKPKEEVSHNTNKQGRSSLISFSPDLEQNQKSGSNNKTSSDDFLQCCSMSFVQLPQSNRAEVDLDFSKTKALNGSEEDLLTPRSERLGEPLESALVHEKIAGDRKQENAHCSKPESGCSGRVSTIQRSTGRQLSLNASFNAFDELDKEMKDPTYSVIRPRKSLAAPEIDRKEVNRLMEEMLDWRCLTTVSRSTRARSVGSSGNQNYQSETENDNGAKTENRDTKSCAPMAPIVISAQLDSLLLDSPKTSPFMKKKLSNGNQRRVSLIEYTQVEDNDEFIASDTFEGYTQFENTQNTNSLATTDLDENAMILKDNENEDSLLENKFARKIVRDSFGCRASVNSRTSSDSRMPLDIIGNEENIKPQSSAGGKNCSTPSNQRTQNPRKSMLRGLSVLSPIEDEGSSFESSSHKSSMSSCNMSDQSANCTDYSAK